MLVAISVPLKRSLWPDCCHLQKHTHTHTQRHRSRGGGGKGVGVAEKWSELELCTTRNFTTCKNCEQRADIIVGLLVTLPWGAD